MFCPDKVFGEEKLNKIKVTQCDSLLEFNVLPVINALSVHNIIATVRAGQPADMPSPDLADDVSDTHVMDSSDTLQAVLVLIQDSG